MDISEEKFHVINTVALWKKGRVLEGIEVTESGLALEKSEQYTYSNAFRPGLLSPLSLALEECGLLYILHEPGSTDPTGKPAKGIYLYEPGKSQSRRIPCLTMDNSRSIAVNSLDLLVAEETKITCRARCNLQVRWETTFRHHHLANIRIASGGGNVLYVLAEDRTLEDHPEVKIFKTGREWELTDNTRIISTVKKQSGQGISLDWLDLDADRDRNLYILQEKSEKDKNSTFEILKFSPEDEYRYWESISIPYEDGTIYRNLAAEGLGNIYLSFVRDLPGTGRQEHGILRLKKEKKYLAKGIYNTGPLDSTIPGCQWHKITLEAEIPENTRIEIAYEAAEEKSRDISPNAPALPAFTGNAADALLEKAVGRYLRFRICLSGDELNNTSPRLKSLNVYFPRRTYLQYLPTVYQEDRSSREYLEKFLSIFETMMTGTEKQVDHLTRYLDAFAAPDNFIPWLSSWLAIAADENWPATKKRKLIAEAPALYKKRGTPAGLSRLIELYYGSAPLIIEYFIFRNLQEPGIIGVLKQMFECSPYGFCVLLKPRQQTSQADLTTIRRIIDSEKPAHTTAGLKILEPWFYLDMHTYLGINTTLSEPVFVLEKSALGRDTVLTERELSGQAVIKSRIGIDLNLT
jgi:phage tail-like protein